MDEGNNRSPLIMLGLGLALFLVVAAFFGLGAVRAGAFSTPMIPLILAVIVLLGIVAVGVAIWQQSNSEKAKHEMDMYEVIDRLVADINEDEANYLWHKINAADRQATATTLSGILDEREQKKSVTDPPDFASR